MNLFNIFNLSFLNIWDTFITTVSISLYIIYFICVIPKSVSIDCFFFLLSSSLTLDVLSHSFLIVCDWVIDCDFILLSAGQIQMYL